MANDAISRAIIAVDEGLQQDRVVGVLGATSFVGACLLPMLTEAGWLVTAFSRSTLGGLHDGVEWRRLPLVEYIAPQSSLRKNKKITPYWICLAPIWVLPDYFDLLNAQCARRVVVLSSTSRFTKDDSSDPEERALALRFADAETRIQKWAESRGVEWIILRPTLIYGLGQDKNITEIARLIRRFGFFPLFGKAEGLRQPIKAADVAGACMAALQAPSAANHAYNLSGGETLTYRNMVARVFSALGLRPRMLTIPLWAFRLTVAILRCLPRYRKWSIAMAERMNHDMVFDHAEATRDFGFQPKGLLLAVEDLPT
jgi:nucleoside-diphosphate-sugar epimerase